MVHKRTWQEVAKYSWKILALDQNRNDFPRCQCKTFFNQSSLAHREQPQGLHIYKESFDDCRIGIAKRTLESDLHEPLAEKGHTLLSFLHERSAAIHCCLRMLKKGFEDVMSLTSLYWLPGTIF